MKGEVYSHRFLETGGMQATQGAHLGEYQDWSGGRRSEWKCEQEPLLWKKWVVQLGLASLNPLLVPGA